MEYSPLRQDTAEMNVVFIHSTLDDADLTPQQFRVYCHLARRSHTRAYPGLPSMSRICRMAEDTVRACLKELQARNMLQIIERPGRTNFYVLTAPSKWDSNNHPPETTPLVNNGTTPPGNKGGRRISTKGNPDKRKERTKLDRSTPWETLPASLNTPEFRAAWLAYEANRRDQKIKPLTARSITMKWADFATWGHDVAVQGINEAIANGYHGIFKPKGRGGNNRSGAPVSEPDFTQGF